VHNAVFVVHCLTKACVHRHTKTKCNIQTPSEISTCKVITATVRFVRRDVYRCGWAVRFSQAPSFDEYSLINIKRIECESHRHMAHRAISNRGRNEVAVKLMIVERCGRSGWSLGFTVAHYIYIYDRVSNACQRAAAVALYSPIRSTAASLWDDRTMSSAVSMHRKPRFVNHSITLDDIVRRHTYACLAACCWLCPCYSEKQSWMKHIKAWKVAAWAPNFSGPSNLQLPR